MTENISTWYQEVFVAKAAAILGTTGMLTFFLNVFFACVAMFLLIEILLMINNKLLLTGMSTEFKDIMATFNDVRSQMDYRQIGWVVAFTSTLVALLGTSTSVKVIAFLLVVITLATAFAFIRRMISTATFLLLMVLRRLGKIELQPMEAENDRAS